MLESFRRLILGLALIAGASALLLTSDLGSRENAATADSAQPRRIAILQHASQVILDQGSDGMLAGLAEKGWTEGNNLVVRRFNAEGDTTVSQAIAREMVNGGYNLLLTISTPSLQAVANANRAGSVNHVFGLVTDPAAAGIGASRTDPLEHPAWLAGYGTMQPVAQAFELARRMNPSLKSVGVVWNASEPNAEAQVRLARAVSARMGINLVEITVENSAGVGESAAALVARGVEAIWVCGDVTVITGVDALIGAARRGRIPVFTVIPPNVRRGALFDIGANYFEVGRLTGLLAGEILHGRSPASVPIENVMPEVLAVNRQAARDLRPGWSVPDDLIERAHMVINADGSERAQPARVSQRAPNPSKRNWQIAVVPYIESPPSEETLAGMADAWKASPLKAGTDYTIKTLSAQGDMSALSGIFDALLTSGADIIVPLSTPSLQTAIRKIRDKPMVFSLVANPMAAGAAKSYDDHLPNLTGVAVLSPYGDMLDLLEKYYPSIKRIGTLFCPAETNSVDLKDALAALCKQRGFTLEAVAANSAGELPSSSHFGLA